MTVLLALDDLATVLQAASSASTLDVRTTAIYGRPPEALPVMPAIIHRWESSRFGTWPYDQVPNGTQLEEATVSALILTGDPTASRAHTLILTLIGQYRSILSQNQSLGDAVRQVRITQARTDEIEWNGQVYHGAELSLEMSIYHTTVWSE